MYSAQHTAAPLAARGEGIVAQQPVLDREPAQRAPVGPGLDEGELRVKRSRVGCFAACKGGPVMCVQPDGTWYYNVTPANMDRIITEHLVGGQPVQELVFHQGPTGG